MRKIVCVLVLSCVIMGTAFAQQEAAVSAQNAVAMDMFTLTKGIIASDKDFTDISISVSYERLLAPHFSIGPDLDFYYLTFDTSDINGFYFCLAAEGRYYPTADFDKFFIGTTLGLNVLSIDGKRKAKDGGFSGLTTSLKMGYKLLIGKMFYMEPSLGYVLSKSSTGVSAKKSGGSLSDIFGGGDISSSLVEISVPTPLGWQGGLRLGVAF